MVTEKQYENIIKLFKECYSDTGRVLHKSMYNWMYYTQPTIVTLRYDGNKLVGHYALRILDKFLDSGFGKVAISFNTMVHPNYQHRGIFISLAKEAYEIARNMNISCIYGFPNKNSAPGFFKHLGWEKLEGVYEYRYDTRSLLTNNHIKECSISNIDTFEVYNLNHRLNNYYPYNRGHYTLIGNFYKDNKITKDWAIYKTYYGPNFVNRHILKVESFTENSKKDMVSFILNKSYEEGFDYVYGWANKDDRIDFYPIEKIRDVTCGQLIFKRGMVKVTTFDSDSY